MKKIFIISLILSLTISAFAQSGEKAKLPVKKVILYNHGVGYFERQGVVNGSQTIDLDFNSNQMNDVLKSLLVLDLDKGLISNVTYDSSKPVNKQLEALSINLSDASGRGLTNLIEQIKGASIEIKTANTSFIGKIVGIEKRRQMVGQNVLETDFLVLSADAGDVRTFELSEIKGFKVIDSKLRSDLEQYLNIINSTHKKDARKIVISAQGEGKRRIVAGYTIEAPIWKTSYRIVLNEKGKPFIQGWAIVDNEQDEDWENVEISLVSGLPVSFIQDLQSVRYRRRPIIPYQENLALNPQVYEESLNAGENDDVKISVNTDKMMSTIDNRLILGVPGQVGRTNNITIDGTDNNNIGGGGLINLTPKPPARFGSIGEQASNAVGQSLGELFEYKVNHLITIKRNSSALIPIVSSNVGGEQISIFNESSGLKNPMNGLLLHNTSNLTLESGPLTVFEGDAYAGESLLSRMKPDEKRYLTYAADLGTLLTTDRDTKSEKVNFIKIINGVFELHYKTIDTKTYTILNKDNKAKTVIIEHPYRKDWKLIEPKETFEETASFRRFRVMVPAKSTIKFPVIEEFSNLETVGILTVSNETVQLYINNKYIDEATAQSLKKILELRQKLSTIALETKAREKQIININADQARIRENLKAMGKSEEERKLVSRFTEKLNETENELEHLRKEVSTFEVDITRLEKELNQLIYSINYNRNL